MRTTIADSGSPILYGVPNNLAVMSDGGESFSAGGGGGGRGGGGGAAVAGGGGRGGAGAGRPTGRGTLDDADAVQGRPATMGTEPLGPPLTTDSTAGGGGRGGAAITVPLELRPRPLLRFDTQEKLLVSGLLEGGSDIAGQTVVVDLPSEKGHYVLFASNPIYRGETIGSYFMVFNAILNFDNLGIGRAAPAPAAPGGGRGGRGGGGGR